MAKKDETLVGRGMRFTWFTPVADRPGTGGLGMKFRWMKKRRSFMAVLSVDDARDLHEFLGKCLKKK